MITINDIDANLIESIRESLKGKKAKIGQSKEKKINVQYDVAPSPTKNNEDGIYSRKNKAAESPSTLMDKGSEVKKSRN